MQMTKEQAIAVFLQKNKSAAKSMERLQQWDTEKTIAENAKALGVLASNATSFAKYFGLDALRSSRDGVRITPGTRDKQKMIKILALKLSPAEIARFMRIKQGYVERLLAHEDIQVAE